MRRASEIPNSVVLAGVVFFGMACSLLRGESFTFTTIAYPDTFTYVTGINDAGEVVGFGVPPGETSLPGFVYAGGAFTPVEFPGMQIPTAINNNGTILSSSGDEFNGSALPSVEALGFISATGINDLGQVVGGYYLSATSNGGFVCDESTCQVLNVPGAISTNANGINDVGQIVGTADINGVSQGFLYEGGYYQPISVPGAYYTDVYGINNQGEIVGTSSLGGFVDVGGLFSTFSVPSGYLLAQVSINNLGQIAGTLESEYFSFDTIGFVGTPVGTTVPTTPAPEPGTIGLVGIGVFGLAGVVRRRWRGRGQ